MERQKHSAEHNTLSAENLESLAHESAAEREHKVESAENKQEQAADAREKIEKHREAHNQSEAKPEPIVTPYDKLRAYRHTLASLQHRLKPSQRRFSRFIHAPIVERTSDALAATVARPSVSLGATVTAALVGGFFYLTARQTGFLLSGSEFIFSLLVGGILGFGIEVLIKSLRRRNK